MEYNDSEKPLASFSSRSFIHGGILKNIMIVTFLSLFVMSILINLGVPILIVVAIFLINIYVLIMWRSGSVRYELFPWGFTQHLSPTFNKNRRIKRVFTWDDVKS